MFNRKNKKLETHVYSRMYVYLIAIRDAVKNLFDGLLVWILSLFSSDSGQKSLQFSSRTVLFRKQDVLGEGAFGTVVQGQDRLSSKKYAIKIMNLLNYEVESVIKNEIESLNKFKHKNIVELIDSVSLVEQSGCKVVYLLFPLCSGGSLRSYLNRIIDYSQSKFPLKNILSDFGKICAAVSTMHDYNPSYIHQDIKPDNILIHDGIPILTDFGSVRLAHREISTRQQVIEKDCKKEERYYIINSIINFSHCCLFSLICFFHIFGLPSFFIIQTSIFLFIYPYVSYFYASVYLSIPELFLQQSNSINIFFPKSKINSRP